jgi:diguanylate cyclase (GGDEF)-like protein/PAS domain S-box-containing protein
MVQIVGYQLKDDLLGQNVFEELFLEAEERKRFEDDLQNKGFVKDFEIKNIRKDGVAVVLSVTSKHIRNDQNCVIGLEGIVRDITEKKNLSDQLENEKKKLEQILVFDEMVGTVKDFDALTKLVVEMTASILEVKRCSLMLVDPQRKDLFIQSAQGLDPQVVKETRIKTGSSIAGTVAQRLKPVLVKNIEYDPEFKRANKPGYESRSFMIAPIVFDEKFIGLLSVTDKIKKGYREEPCNEIDLKILTAICRETAIAIENVKLYKELKSLTFTDPLTHIYNYRHFAKSLKAEIKRIKRFQTALSIMMIDVDDFKTYNDSFGHLEGDALLRAVSDMMLSSLRETDIICRYAGDEFAVILPDTTIEGAFVAAQKLQQALGTHTFKKPVTLSIGVAQYKDDMSEYDFILKADQALYQVKRSGKNKISH